MPDDVVQPDSGAMPLAPKRRRRRRRKPLSSQVPSVPGQVAPMPPPSSYAPPVQTSDFDTVAQDVEDRMEDPSPSVQAMEKMAKPLLVEESPPDASAGVPVMPVYQEPPSPPTPAVETYSAPSVGQAPQPIPETPSVASIPPTPAANYDPFSDPFNDPFGSSSSDYPDPMSQPIFPPDEPEMKAPESQPEPEVSLEPLEGEIVSETSIEPPAGPLAESATPTESLDELAVQGSFSERLEKLLHDANITPRQIKFCCGGLVMIFILIGAGWFLIPKVLENGLPDFGGDEEKNEPVSDEKTEQPDRDEEEPSIAPPQPLNTQAWVDPSVFVGLSLGNPAAILPGDTGVTSGILVGEQEKLNHDFSQLQAFVFDLDALYRLYRADLDALLDVSSNRTATLEQHLIELRAVYNRNFANYDEIIRIKDSFGDRFNTLQPQKETAEIDFFNQIRAFQGATAEQQLLQFIDLSQSQVDFKAKYFAFGKLQTMYETILPPFKKRIEDIEYNRAALISDVQVVDVIGSDLDLIVGEEEL